MSKNSRAQSGTGLVDALSGAKVRQFSDTGGYYVEASGVRHFWGRLLDGLVFLVVVGLIFGASSAAVGPSVATLICGLLWFPMLFIYGMIWGSVGLLGDKAGHMLSVRQKNGTTAGPWIGGWRAILWSFAPAYLILIVISLFDGDFDFLSNYTAVATDSGIAKGIPPVPA